MKNKKIIAVIPARGNSKAIPKKNIYKILGKPLIYYTINEAKKSKFITYILLSTDSKKIKKIAEKIGAPAPFLRPKNLSTDFVPSLPVVKHAVNFMEKIKGEKYDYILMLQPTSPLRKFKDIDDSIKHLEQVDGVMLGRSPYDNPMIVSNVDSIIFNEKRCFGSNNYRKYIA